MWATKGACLCLASESFMVPCPLQRYLVLQTLLIFMPTEKTFRKT